MMLKKLFSAHSPVWQLLFAISGILIVSTLYSVFALGHTTMPIIVIEQTSAGQIASMAINPWLAAGLLIGTSSIVAYSIICKRYNKGNGSNLRPFSFKPNEIIGNDERLLQASANAALKIYSQNQVLFPLMALALLFAVGSGVQVLTVVLMASVAIYYITYLKAMWPYLGDE